MATDSDRVDWSDRGVPVSARFGDPYYSFEDGLAETCHVYLAGNGLPGRFRDGFRIAELGFGTGLNLLAACRAWQECGAAGTLHFTSFEAYPMAPCDMARALSSFALAPGLREPLLGAWTRGDWQFDIGSVSVEVIVGDARRTLQDWTGQADAWFLDGFSPAKNPELWEPGLLAEVARHTAPGGTLATYSAAGSIRRGLQAAGLRVERRPGFGRKRHMTAGQKEGRTA